MDLTIVYILAFIFSLVVAGYFLPSLKNKLVARTLAWSIVILTTCFSTYISWNDSALFRMLTIVTLQLISMKVVVLTETYSGKPNLSFIQWSAFSLGWFGMRPTLFEKLFSKRLQFLNLVTLGASRIIIGVLLLFISKLIQDQPWSTFHLSDLLLLVGLSFILHFGILNLATALWRALGVDVKELFRSPYKATSLKEFWGKRWNIAFSEMTALVVYRPFRNKLGNTNAMLASFILSGILHEIAISFPVKSGYGLPLLYFFIHGLLMYSESELTFAKKIISHKILSHIWVLGWLILPMPLLFHDQFLQLVLRPIRDYILGIF